MMRYRSTAQVGLSLIVGQVQGLRLGFHLRADAAVSGDDKACHTGGKDTLRLETIDY